MKAIILSLAIVASTIVAMSVPASAMTCYQNSPYSGGSWVCRD